MQPQHMFFHYSWGPSFHKHFLSGFSQIRVDVPEKWSLNRDYHFISNVLNLCLQQFSIICLDTFKNVFHVPVTAIHVLNDYNWNSSFCIVFLLSAFWSVNINQGQTWRLCSAIQSHCSGNSLLLFWMTMPINSVENWLSI